MSTPNIKNKAVTFNIEDPYQKQLLDYVMCKSRNFSNYLKILIERDMRGAQFTPAPVEVNANTSSPSIVGVDQFKNTNVDNMF